MPLEFEKIENKGTDLINDFPLEIFEFKKLNFDEKDSTIYDIKPFFTGSILHIILRYPHLLSQIIMLDVNNNRIV